MAQYSGEVVPTNFGLKYNPAMLGVQYYFKENKKATFVHEIPLSGLSEGQDVTNFVQTLFSDNSTFLNPQKVLPMQVEKLIQKMMDRLYPENKENLQKNTEVLEVEDIKPQLESPKIEATPVSPEQEEDSAVANAPTDTDHNLNEDTPNEEPNFDNDSDQEGSGGEIDIENEEELEARGFRKIQIEGEEEEFLMDEQGRIYDLQGNFIGETNEEDDEEG